MKSLPWPKHFSHSFVLFGLIASAVSCDDDNDSSLSNTTTQFAKTELTIAENAGEQTIVLSLNNIAPIDGEVVVQVNAITPTCYSTTPLAELGQLKVDVQKGLRKAYFKLTPTDNASLDGDKTVQFTITTVSRGYVTGVSREMLVTVTDDEVPGAAGFASSEIRVRENNTDAAELEILFPAPITADGVLVVELQSAAAYGSEYITQPQAANGKIFLQVPKGSSSAVINLYPVDDKVLKADRVINFKLVDSNGGVSIGHNNTIEATITDDDGHMLTDISLVRSRYEDAPIIFTEDTFIEAVVTSGTNTLSGRVVVEDETGALPIQFQSGISPQRGDVILINLRNAQLRQLLGQLEAGVVSTYEKMSDGNVPATRISLASLLEQPERMESRTVQLVNVSFSQANGTTTFLGDRILTDGTEKIMVRTGANAGFANEIVPSGSVTVTGILADINGVYVLYPQELKDIKKQGLTPPRNGLTPRPL